MHVSVQNFQSENSAWDWKHNFKPFGLDGAIKWWEEKSHLINKSVNHNGVCRAPPDFVGSSKC